MDSDLFEEWIRELDGKFVREDRKVVLIVDNCPAHPHVGGLKSIRLCFLPANTKTADGPRCNSFFEGKVPVPNGPDDN